MYGACLTKTYYRNMIHVIRKFSRMFCFKHGIQCDHLWLRFFIPFGSEHKNTKTGWSSYSIVGIMSLCNVIHWLREYFIYGLLKWLNLSRVCTFMGRMASYFVQSVNNNIELCRMLFFLLLSFLSQHCRFSFE